MLKDVTKMPEYHAWISMRIRCHKIGSWAYGDYGGRGIVVCQEWRNSFEEFFRYIGARPSEKHSVDRINNDGNYEPGNVRWALPIVQLNNSRHVKRVAFDGRVQTMEAWAKEYDVSYAALRGRLAKGLSVGEAVKRMRDYEKESGQPVHYSPPKPQVRSGRQRFQRDRSVARRVA